MLDGMSRDYKVHPPKQTVSGHVKPVVSGERLTKHDFDRVNFAVHVCDIDGGFFNGGTSVVINRQNSDKLFIDNSTERKEWDISSFDEALKIANEYLSR
jgi:hypothetical protein